MSELTTSGDGIDQLDGDSVLDVEELRTVFETDRGPLVAVDGVSVSVERRSTLGIVGESGSGKTALVRSIMGLLPDSARRTGSIRFAGRRIDHLSPPEMRHLWGPEMAMVFQNPLNSLNPVMKVGHQIAEPLRLHLGMDKPTARATAARLLHDVHIPEPERRLDQYPHELSGGMRQRVMIAMALACGPTVLFADEPTTALDVTVQSQILDLIDEQRHEREMAVVLVTHDLGVIARHTDHVAVVYGGRVVERAPTRSLFSNVQMPYTRALLESIPKLDDPSHTRLATVPGRPPDPADRLPGCPFAPRCAHAGDRCHVEQPPLVAGDDPDHLVACWFPPGSSPVVAHDSGGRDLEVTVRAVGGGG